MAAKRIGQFSVDWAELAKRVPASQKSNYQAFKAKSDGFLRKVLSNPEEPPKIDWSYYKSNAVNKAVVEQFEKLYASTKIPFPEDKGALAQVINEEKVELEKVAKFVQLSNERIKEFEKEVVAIESVPDFENMTLEEFAYHYPNLALNPLEKPTMFPHTPETQLTEEDVAYGRSVGHFHKEPDKYYK